MRLAKTTVKVRELSLDWFPTSTMVLTLVQQLAISCDFTDSRTMRVKNDNIIMWERTKDENHTYTPIELFNYRKPLFFSNRHSRSLTMKPRL